MNIASRWIVVLGLTALLSQTAAPTTAMAQDVQVTGPLAGAPAVRKMRVYRDGRFSVRLGPGFSVLDEYVRHIYVQGQLQYHITDWLGVAAFGGYAVAQLNTAGLTDQISGSGITTDNNILNLPSRGGFEDQVGKLTFLAGGQLTFIPLRGKLAMFQALFVDTDFYIFAGAAAAGVEERADVILNADGSGHPCAVDPSANAQACVASQGARTSRIAIAPTFGVGLSMFLADYAALTLEWRAFPFKWNNSGTDQSGENANRMPDSNGGFPDGSLDENDRLFHFNQMMSVNAAFYFPMTAVITE